MQRRLRIFSLMTLSTLVSCTQFSTGRNFLSDGGEDSGSGGSFYKPSNDFPVMAGDTGRIGETEEERRSRAPSSEEFESDRATYALERERAELEDTQSESALAFYSIHKNKLKTTSEKIYFLKLPKGERREYLISKGLIKEDEHHFSDRVRIKAIGHSNIMLGMNKNDVVDSWGRPIKVEVAGNPSYENERWAYNVNGATKYVYFESGKVEGWE